MNAPSEVDQSHGGRNRARLLHTIEGCASALCALLVTVASVAASEPGGRDNLAGESDLPHGNGLATAFPGDAGIGGCAEVIFAEDFESGELGGKWDESRNKDGKVLSFALVTNLSLMDDERLDFLLEHLKPESR